MQGGDDRAEDDDGFHPAFDETGGFVPLQSLKHGGGKFHRQHGDINHHIQPDKEQEGCEILIAQKVPDALRLTGFHQQGNPFHHIAEQTRQQGWAQKRTEFFQLEDVNDGR